MEKNNSIVVYTDDGLLSEEFKQFQYAYDLVAVGSRYLCLTQGDTTYFSEAGNWRTFRSLCFPGSYISSEVTTSHSLLCTIDTQGCLITVDTETWRQPVIMDVTEQGVQMRVRPPGTSLIARVGRRLRRGEEDVGFAIALAQTGEWLAVAAGNTIHVTKPRTGENIKTIRIDAEVDGLKSFSGGTRLAVGTERTIQYWNATTWTLDKEIEFDHRSVSNGAWSPDGTLLATVSNGQTLQIRDSADLTSMTELRLDGEVHGCAWLDHARLVAVGKRGVYWLAFQPAR